MSKNEEKKEGWSRGEKALGIIAIFLVGGYFLLMFGFFDNLHYDAWDTPIHLTEPSRTWNCQKAIQDFTVFKEFLGVGNVLTTEQIDAMSYSDYLYLTELEMEIQRLNCSLEPDT